LRATHPTAAALSTIPEEDIIGVPLLLHTPAGSWVAITEADLTEYAGMYVQRSSQEGRQVLTSTLAPAAQLGRQHSGLLDGYGTPYTVLKKVLKDSTGDMYESASRRQ
jgi:hypothetical protein